MCPPHRRASRRRQPGGEGPSDARARRALEDREAATRIGVLGKEEDGVSFEVLDDRSAVMSLGFGDKRNYVEACMCDAAVAFEGGDGTKSEVAFCLALGRPVVLVGDAWTDDFPIRRDEASLQDFLAASRNRVKPTGEDDIDRLIADAYATLTISRDRVIHQVSLERPVDAVRLAGHCAAEAHHGGASPIYPIARPSRRNTSPGWRASSGERPRACPAIVGAARHQSVLPDRGGAHRPSRKPGTWSAG